MTDSAKFASQLGVSEDFFKNIHAPTNLPEHVEAFVAKHAIPRVDDDFNDEHIMIVQRVVDNDRILHLLPADIRQRNRTGKCSRCHEPIRYDPQSSPNLAKATFVCMQCAPELEKEAGE